MAAVRPKLESKIQYEIMLFMLARGWTVLNMTGNQYQKGVPDLYAHHPTHGHKWVEVKRPKGYKFTKWQLIVFPILEASKDDVFILVEASMSEYKKLFGEPNWRQYLKPSHLSTMRKLEPQRRPITQAWLTAP